MDKIVNLGDFSERAEYVYYDHMTSFWDEHDLYWKLSNGGFYLWSIYVDAGNKLIPNDMQNLAAAANLLIIEYNKDRILEEGHSDFVDHLTSYDPTKLGWNEDANEDRFGK